MRVTIIADASHCPDTCAAGYGYWIASERGKLGGGGAMKGRVDTSGAAEMLAICNALFIAVEKKLVETGDIVLIQTDCVSAIRAFDGSRNGLTCDEKKAFEHLHGLVAKAQIRVTYRHVKGHTSRPGARYITNKLCDQRAKAGMRSARAYIQAGGGDNPCTSESMAT